ncbi:Rab-GTPase-TBC domain [Dillenia turbinata]|uniref:Rab-GTPase-TBC domain n=1 Tax=Dillenia turbinata TaxID=194707 RepID=A0AAN8VYR9_9MAGN
MKETNSNLMNAFDYRRRSLEVDSRDAYGFALRPQHLQRYRQYAKIYKEEEEERSNKWKGFIDQQAEFAELCYYEEVFDKALRVEFTGLKEEEASERRGNELSVSYSTSEVSEERAFEKDVLPRRRRKNHRIRAWGRVRPALGAIEYMMSFRVSKDTIGINNGKLGNVKENHSAGASEGNFKECYSDVDVLGNNVTVSGANAALGDGITAEHIFPWKEELEFLVRGGVPREIRGEVWQAFVGVKVRRVEKYYQDLLASETPAGDIRGHNDSLPPNGRKQSNSKKAGVPEKWKRQIEKDLPRTFPGHPALDEDGRDSLRRLLLAYARHNPSVGYCQAMNFFAGLLLLFMPEENAFWTLVGIIDDYFEGCYSEDMIESQVDQLVFEELMRERFPKLVNHLDYLGVQVAWISGSWFLSIFVNMLPWESVLRVWDVLLFEGNRVMLFRTALALMELYGPALITTKDAGDAITLFQSLAGSTFDCSQLVLTACMGFLAVTEARLQELRDKHRPAVLRAVEERSKVGEVRRDPKGLATKLYSFKHDKGVKETHAAEKSYDVLTDGDLPQMVSGVSDLDTFLNGLTVSSELDSIPDLQEQVELCRLLEEKRSATLRAEELETALMEMVKQDNRRQLSAKVELLELEVAELRQLVADKQEQEKAMLQVLMRVEQEQRLTEDARISAEQDAAAQRYLVHVLQEKYEKTMAALAEMEKRAVVAESSLEATLQYESGQARALSSPRAAAEGTMRRIGLLSRPFAGWRDRNKAKHANTGEPDDSSEHKNEELCISTSQNESILPPAGIA